MKQPTGPVTVKHRAVSSLLLLVPAVAVLVTRMLLGAQAPKVVATHWSGLDYPDGFSSFGPFYGVCLGIAAAGALLGLAGMGAKRPTAQLLMLFLGGLAAWTCGTMFIGCVLPTVLAGDPAQAQLGAWNLLLIAGSLLGLVPAWISGVYQQANRGMKQERDERIAQGQGRELPQALPVAQQPLQRSVNAPVWLWVLSAGLLVFTVVMFFVLDGSAENGGVLGLLTGPVLLLFALALLLGVCRITVRVDEKGLLVTSGILGFTMRRIPLGQIQSVDSEWIAPGQWGGWGWRFFPGGSAIVFRAMDGLVVHTTGDKRFAVTMEDSEAVRDQLLARMHQAEPRD